MVNAKQETSKNSYTDNLSVTVAIPCYNAEKYLQGLLESLNRQTRLPDEIIVIDDGSSDRTKEIAKTYNVKLIEHGKNKGLACARNSAIKNSKGDIIVFFDADTIPNKKNIEWMLKEYTNSKIAGVGGQEYFVKSSRTIDLWRHLFWRQTHGNEKIDNAWMLMGLCCSFKKDILIEIGGFSKEYRKNGEDVDVGIRLTHAGYHLVYLPEIGIDHKRNDSFKSLLSLVYRHSFWQSRALRKNGINPSNQIKQAFKWFFVCLGSSLITHKNIRLFAMSPVFCLSAIVGRLMDLYYRKEINFSVP